MKTRDRILERSLALFNDAGLAIVSTHRIAADLGISPGNLYYHFRNKGQIVEWLIRRFEQRVTPLLQATTAVVALDDWWLTLHLSLEATTAYRFLYRDVDYLLHEYPRCGARVQHLAALSVQAATRQCEQLLASGILRAQPAEIATLGRQIGFTTTCWPTFSRLMRLGDETAQAPEQAAYHVLVLMSPYVDGASRQYLEYLRSKYLQ
ncbi:MAG: TetR/AcrR family transcriptional regulator [Steroidobacteraceae bacterium]